MLEPKYELDLIPGYVNDERGEREEEAEALVVPGDASIRSFEDLRREVDIEPEPEPERGLEREAGTELDTGPETEVRRECVRGYGETLSRTLRLCPRPSLRRSIGLNELPRVGFGIVRELGTVGWGVRRRNGCACELSAGGSMCMREMLGCRIDARDEGRPVKIRKFMLMND